MFWGAIGKPKEDCKRTRERTVIQSKRNARYHPSQTQQQAVPDKGTRSPKKNQENDRLTTKPLSGMGHLCALARGKAHHIITPRAGCLGHQ